MQQNHRQNPVQPEISHPQAERQPLIQNQQPDLYAAPQQGTEQPAQGVEQLLQRIPQVDWTSQIANVIQKSIQLETQSPASDV